MKLQSHISRIYKEKKYSKYWVIIPNKTIKLLGWKTGDSLEIDVKNSKLVIEKEGHTHTVLKKKETLI